ncbi:hypothetical protein JXM83_00595 [Candidatus Woesearchaeota archaeon]|nr:hypothetical protein [Candidatus Woesearchaeota archaeon]
MSKKAEVGIGTLVLFIAMILVAAIAAGVLIQTASTLQSKALQTGSRSTAQIGTALTTVMVYGEDALIDNSIEILYQTVKLTPGSDFISLNDSMITVDLTNSSVELLYNATAPCDATVGSLQFGVRYLKNGSGHINGYVGTGDVVQFCYRPPSSIREDSTYRIMFVPKVGSVMTVQGTTPGTITTRRVFLYP